MHGPKTADPAPLGGTRSEAVQRLQIGISGVVVMMMLIGLADVITDRANEADAASVPAAASTAAPDAKTSAQSDPLAEAGIVPDLPTEPSPSPAQESAVMPEQGLNPQAN